MRLLRLHFHSVRNLHDASLSLASGINLFVGNNGGGKTSVLEAAHMLAMGRSFRSRRVQNVIHYQADALACFGEVLTAEDTKTSLGIEKTRRGAVTCKVQGEICYRLSDYAAVLPVQVITPETVSLLTAGAEERRRFVDWGVFHVEHSFATHCQTYLRALKQRNAALRASMGGGSDGLMQWEHILISSGERITAYRQTYLTEFQRFVKEACQRWQLTQPIEMRYLPGWEGSNLEGAIQRARASDCLRGFTSVGPHRAEIQMTVNGCLARDVLSRGQQKLLIFALYTAQAKQLAQRAEGKKSLFLIDDLASELDFENRARLLNELQEGQQQVLMTSIEPMDQEKIKGAGKMFHVEHGKVSCND